MNRYLNTPEEITAALKEGKVVLDRTGNKYKSINGFIVVSYISGGWGVDPFIGNHAGLYVDEPKPLKLEVGKFYKTRDGRKALVYGKYKETNEVYPYTVVVVGEPMSEICVSKAGEVVVGAENIEDLVAPWEED